MRYSYEFKVECVEQYRQGRWMEPPKGIKTENFHKKIRRWVRQTELNGFESLRHKPQNKEWTAEEKYELVAKVIALREEREAARLKAKKHQSSKISVRKESN